MSAANSEERLKRFDPENVAHLAEFLAKVSTAADTFEKDGIVHFYEEYDGDEGNEESRRVVFTENFEGHDSDQDCSRQASQLKVSREEENSRTQREVSETLSDLQRLVDMEEKHDGLTGGTKELEESVGSKCKSSNCSKSEFSDGFRKGFLLDTKSDALVKPGRLRKQTAELKEKATKNAEVREVGHTSAVAHKEAKHVAECVSILRKDKTKTKKKTTKRVSFALPEGGASSDSACNRSETVVRHAGATSRADKSSCGSMNVSNTVIDSDWSGAKISENSSILKQVERAVARDDDDDDDDNDDDVLLEDRLEFIEQLLKMEAEAAEDETEKTESDVVRSSDEEEEIAGQFGTGFISGFLEPSTTPIPRRESRDCGMSSMSSSEHSSEVPHCIESDDHEHKKALWEDDRMLREEVIGNVVVERSHGKRRPRRKARAVSDEVQGDRMMGQLEFSGRARQESCNEVEPIVYADENDDEGDGTRGGKTGFSRFKQTRMARLKV